MSTVVRSREVAFRWIATPRPLSNPSIGPICVLALAPVPFLSLHAQTIWARPHYQLFPLVPLGAAVLAWRECRRLGPLRPGPRRTVAALAIAAWLLLALASFLVSPWLGSVAALAMLAAAIVTIGGGTLLRSLLPAGAFLTLAVGLPLQVDQQLISRLQSLTSRIASLALDALGAFHVMEGNVVRVSGRAFGVEEACSGIYSLFSVVFCTSFFVLWARRPPIRALFTIVAGAFWVLGANIVRVVAVVYLDTRWGADLSGGWRHELLSLAAFGATLLLVASTDCLLDFWPAFVQFWRAPRADELSPDATEDESELVEFPGPARDSQTPLALGAPTCVPGVQRTWLCSWTTVASFALLGLVQIVAIVGPRPWQNGAEGLLTIGWSGSNHHRGLMALQSDSLPAHSGSFCRQDFHTEARVAGSAQGEMSRYWRYQFGDSPAIVSVDFPFQGWHELSICYLSQGWALVERKQVRDQAAADGDGTPSPVVIAKLVKGPARHGYLLFCLFDEWENPVEPEDPDKWGLLRDRVAFWLNSWGGNGKRATTGGPALSESYQVQLFIESDYALTDTEQNEARSFFHELRSAILRHGQGAGEIGS